MDIKGQKMLKVTSILMIIGGSLALLLAVFTALGVGVLSAAATNAGGEFSVTLAWVLVAIALVGAVAELVAGIVGVKAAAMPSVGKIKASLLLGVLVVLICIGNNVYSLISGTKFEIVTLVGIAISFVVPVLYVIGVVNYKNALVALMSGE